jgi:hypothetical protein
LMILLRTAAKLTGSAKVRLRTEARAWNRRINRDRVKISWKFDRKAAPPEVTLEIRSFTERGPSGIHGSATRAAERLAGQRSYEQPDDRVASQRRNPYSLVTLAPGVMPAGGTGTGPIVNGVRSNTSEVMFDGAESLRAGRVKSDSSVPIDRLVSEYNQDCFAEGRRASQRTLDVIDSLRESVVPRHLPMMVVLALACAIP